MSTQKYLEYFDSAIGLYKQGLDLLSPEKDDISIISGCILIAIGFEKFIKYVLEKENQLMVLQKVEFQDVLNFRKGKRIGAKNTDGSKNTVTLQEGFDRLVKIFPELKMEMHNIKEIVNDRNFLVHGSGDFSLGKTEKRIRANVTSISELICSVCLKKSPVEIFGENTWEVMKNFRDAYEQSKALKLEERLDFLKRLYLHDEKLTCQKIQLLKDQKSLIPCQATYDIYNCPICNGKALVETDWDIDVDRDDFGVSVLTNAYPSLNAFVCSKCGFTLSDYEEIETLIGQETVRKIFTMENE
ncbi:MAG: hypothetical protein RM368_27940 [Nostoc sp. DedSLP03]|uniref:hypothetical protein n=1 Tax=Nostoc sp. DedSLP03 TaxID=3075400 RepID=UPI002AD589DB|nr:hypothetical protein [Nostoc sp. DedSLP03]MDZ7968739.1 hypothetical protein [Nostoc sp. DedSLP03]